MVQNDVKGVSNKHRIVRMIDRITADGAFLIVRADCAMPCDTYAADRLLTACIAFCLEEKAGSDVNGGWVEYIPDGVARFHKNQPRDRRQVIATLHKLTAIHNGEMPQHHSNAPCNRCTYKERCESRGGHPL
ncbi:MAG: hypothetical protein WCF90_04800 [Methanomicrobiales archaeon]